MKTDKRLTTMFVQLLAWMTNSALNYDGFAWRIESVSELRDGEWQALWRCDWPKDQHDASACMSVFMHSDRPPSIRAETCTLGPYTTKAMQALENRFLKSLKQLRREYGVQPATGGKDV